MADDNKVVRMQVTMKPDVVKNLDQMSEDWGLSRSGMLTVLVQNRVREDKAMNMTEEFHEVMAKLQELQEESK